MAASGRATYAAWPTSLAPTTVCLRPGVANFNRHRSLLDKPKSPSVRIKSGQSGST